MWVGGYVAPSDLATSFVVMSPEGELVAQVEVDARVSLLEAGSDYLLFLIKDVYDVESVVSVRLPSLVP